MNKLELHESILNNSQITLARLENRIVQALVVQKKRKSARTINHDILLKKTENYGKIILRIFYKSENGKG